MSAARLVPAVLLARARAMRHEPTSAEKKMWSCVRDRQLGGFKFRRQRAIPPFIADFFCAELNLVVELDGDSHGDRAAYDARRTIRLSRDGYRVVRYVDEDVHWHLDEVLEDLLGECELLATTKSPSP